MNMTNWGNWKRNPLTNRRHGFGDRKLWIQYKGMVTGDEPGLLKWRIPLQGRGFFGFDLGYDKTTTIVPTTSYLTGQYNGNITGTIWKSRGDGIRRKFDFEYDEANRFGKAYYQNTSGSTRGEYQRWTTVCMVLMQTTTNGWNMMPMVIFWAWYSMALRYGLTPTGYVDALRYTYFAGSNKLKTVSDDYSDPNTKLGDFSAMAVMAPLMITVTMQTATWTWIIIKPSAVSLIITWTCRQSLP